MAKKNSVKRAGKARSTKAKAKPITGKHSSIAMPPAEQSLATPIRRKLPSAWVITRQAAELLWRYRRLFLALTLTYGLLNLVLVRGLAGGTNVSQLKSQLSQAFSGHFGALGSSLSVFVVLLGSSGNSSSNTAGAYQLFLVLIVSLAVIWALRQLLAGARVPRLRDAFYSGMYPLIPFLLVLIVVGLELIPALVGATLYNLVISNGIAVHLIEKILWAVLFALLVLLSLYMLTSSLFALYIVTLPDMTPRRALRSAKELVQKRRWTVMRKVLFLPLMLLIMAAIIMLPIIIWAAPLAQWVFFLLTMFGLVAVHTYMYTLYRELLNE